jgi:hypothetical protein
MCRIDMSFEMIFSAIRFFTWIIRASISHLIHTRHVDGGITGEQPERCEKE